MPFFDYLKEHPDEAALFSQTMIGFHGAEPDAVAAAYDFSDLTGIVDVGGATGNMLAAILDGHAGSRGLLFDLPHVVSEAPAVLAAKGVVDRIEIAGGDMFEAVPHGGDAYLLSHVLHDWPEERCLTILDRCRAAMPSCSRLLVVEIVLPEGNEAHPGKMLDMAMLAVANGEERTEAGYRQLLTKAGFRLVRTVPTNSAVSVMEAVPDGA